MFDLALGDNIFVESKLESFLQEIEIIFDTEQTELLGDTKFGSNFHNYLWTLKPNEEELQTYVSNLIADCTYRNDYDVDISTEILPGTERDIYLLQLIITDETGEQHKKIYAYK